MLHSTAPLHRWHIMMYHRNAMPLVTGHAWRGRWGAMHIRYGRTLMTEKLTDTRLPTMVDRQALNHWHTTRLRQQQIYMSYARHTNSTIRAKQKGIELRRRLFRRVQLSFIHFMQYKIMKNLEQRAVLVNRYGQVAVNTALGDDLPIVAVDEAARRGGKGSSSGISSTSGGAAVPPAAAAAASRPAGASPAAQAAQTASSEYQRAHARRFQMVRRRAIQPPPIGTAPRHVATFKQLITDRFDSRRRIN